MAWARSNIMRLRVCMSGTKAQICHVAVADFDLVQKLRDDADDVRVFFQRAVRHGAHHARATTAIDDV